MVGRHAAPFKGAKRSQNFPRTPCGPCERKCRPKCRQKLPGKNCRPKMSAKTCRHEPAAVSSTACPDWPLCSELAGVGLGPPPQSPAQRVPIGCCARSWRVSSPACPDWPLGVWSDGSSPCKMPNVTEPWSDESAFQTSLDLFPNVTETGFRISCSNVPGPPWL